VSKHPDRPAIEAALVADTPVSSVSSATDLNERSLYRSKAVLMREARARAHRDRESTVATFADRLTDIADQAERIRLRVEDSNPKLAYEAGRAEAAALRDLADRYGITTDSVAAELAEADALAKALVDVLPQYGPQLPQHLAHAARTRGAESVAVALESLAANFIAHTQTRSQKEN
jgi:hypothetical protein